MSELALSRSGMIMPSRYVEIDREEMTYIEGGFSFNRVWLAIGLDALFMATPLAAGLAPLKFLGREAARSLLKRYAPELAGCVFGMVKAVTGIAGSALGNLSVSGILSLIDNNIGGLTSMGGTIALIADFASDRNLDGVIRI